MAKDPMEMHYTTHAEWEDILDKRHKAEEIAKYNEAFNAGVDACIEKVTALSFMNLQAQLAGLKKI